MISAIEATRIRREIAETEALKAASFCDAVLTVGSVAYGANYSV